MRERFQHPVTKNRFLPESEMPASSLQKLRAIGNNTRSPLSSCVRVITIESKPESYSGFIDPVELGWSKPEDEIQPTIDLQAS